MIDGQISSIALLGYPHVTLSKRTYIRAECLKESIANLY
jgi:hypothetical protein